jgi:hypothetical protein
VVCYAAGGEGGHRRILEFDRHGTLLALLRWTGDALEAAWVRGPAGTWLTIEPRAGGATPWVTADRLATCERPGAPSTPRSLFESVDWARPDRIPTLAEPGRIPPGGGTVVLNLLAALAVDAGVDRLGYAGPFPGEQLFLSLLESFRWHARDAATGGRIGDPLAAFAAGALAWEPAPHERLLTPEGALVHLRGRVEKVAWRGRVYHRPDWQGVARHAPRRVRDQDGSVRCSLWALGTLIEDHLVLTGTGDVRQVLAPAPAPAESCPLPPAVARGVAAVVGATSVPALARFVAAEAGRLTLEWGPVAGDLVEIRGARARVSAALREALGRQARRRTAAGRAEVGLAALVEIAMLLGDDLRARAQARIAALPAAEQAAALAAPPAPGPDDARAITDAVEALLAGVPT